MKNDKENKSYQAMPVKVTSFSHIYKVLKENDLSTLHLQYNNRKIIPFRFTAYCGIDISPNDKCLKEHIVLSLYMSCSATMLTANSVYDVGTNLKFMEELTDDELRRFCMAVIRQDYYMKCPSWRNYSPFKIVFLYPFYLLKEPREKEIQLLLEELIQADNLEEQQAARINSAINSIKEKTLMDSDERSVLFWKKSLGRRHDRYGRLNEPETRKIINLVFDRTGIPQNTYFENETFFYDISINEENIRIIYGRIGGPGIEMTRKHSSVAEAEKAYHDLFDSLKNKGYLEILKGRDPPEVHKIEDIYLTDSCYLVNKAENKYWETALQEGKIVVHEGGIGTMGTRFCPYDQEPGKNTQTEMDNLISTMEKRGYIHRNMKAPLENEETAYIKFIRWSEKLPDLELVKSSIGFFLPKKPLQQLETTIDGISWTLIFIKPGNYVLYNQAFGGLNSGNWTFVWGGEQWISTLPVSWVLWQKVAVWAGTKGYTFQNRGKQSTASAAVVDVTPGDCELWCKALTERQNSDYEYKLPDESVLQVALAYNLIIRDNDMPEWYAKADAQIFDTAITGFRFIRVKKRIQKASLSLQQQEQNTRDRIFGIEQDANPTGILTLTERNKVQEFLDLFFIKENHWYEYTKEKKSWRLYESNQSIATECFLDDRNIIRNTYELASYPFTPAKIVAGMRNLIEQKKRSGYEEMADKAFYPGVCTVKRVTSVKDLYTALAGDDGKTLYYFAGTKGYTFNIFPAAYKFPEKYELKDKKLFKEHILLTYFNERIDNWEEISAAFINKDKVLISAFLLHNFDMKNRRKLFPLILKLSKDYTVDDLTVLLQKLNFPEEYWKKIVNDNIRNAFSIPLLAAIMKVVNQFSLQELKEIIMKINIDRAYRQAYEQLFRQIEVKICALGPDASAIKKIAANIASALAAESSAEQDPDASGEGDSYKYTEITMTGEQRIALEQAVKAADMGRSRFPVELVGKPEPDCSFYIYSSDYDLGHTDIILALFKYGYGAFESVEDLLEEAGEKNFDLQIFQKKGRTLYAYIWGPGDNDSGYVVDGDTYQLVGVNHDSCFLFADEASAEVLCGRGNLDYDPENPDDSKVTRFKRRR